MRIASRAHWRRAQQAGCSAGAMAAPPVPQGPRTMVAGAGFAVVAALLVLLLPVSRPGGSALAASEWPAAGMPGPSAVGAASGLDQSAGPSGRGPARAWEIPRRYPVDEATFDRLKAEANARADADADAQDNETPAEGVP